MVCRGGGLNQYQRDEADADVYDMTERTIRSPKMTPISWGRIEVDTLGVGKDFKLYPGGGRAWDWNETGMRHVPGLQPSDVAELLDHGSTIIVLSRGLQLGLQTCPETLELLGGRGITVHGQETRAAVALYNRLAGDQPVGGYTTPCVDVIAGKEQQEAEARGVRPCAGHGADEARTVS
jgi:hypothetical protein